MQILYNWELLEMPGRPWLSAWSLSSPKAPKPSSLMIPRVPSSSSPVCPVCYFQMQYPRITVEEGRDKGETVRSSIIDSFFIRRCCTAWVRSLPLHWSWGRKGDEEEGGWWCLVIWKKLDEQEGGDGCKCDPLAKRGEIYRGKGGFK